MVNTPSDNPLDIYFLMDISASLSDDIAFLRDLSSNLSEELTHHYRHSTISHTTYTTIIIVVWYNLTFLFVRSFKHTARLLQGLTTSLHLGIGTFVDKPVIPYTPEVNFM